MILLAQFRQFSQLFGRTLMGMLVFVWLTMALAPCVMASSVSIFDLTQLQADSDASLSKLHTTMQNCDYCPDANSTTTMATLCQNSHSNIADTMNLAVDSIDVESFVLFEIPAELLTESLYNLATTSEILAYPHYIALSPLALTGILRI